MSDERHGLLASGKEIACKKCGTSFVPTGPRSTLCCSCRKVRDGRSNVPVTNEKKFCQRCQTWKFRYRDFYERIAGSGSYTSYCKDCKKQLAQLYSRTANKALQERNANGSGGTISPQLYAHLCREQGGLCKSCGDPEVVFDATTQLPRRLIFYVNSNGVRGLICFFCDLAAKGVRDCPQRAAKLSAFLMPAPAVSNGEVRIHVEPPEERPDDTMPPALDAPKGEQ